MYSLSFAGTFCEGVAAVTAGDRAHDEKTEPGSLHFVRL